MKPKVLITDLVDDLLINGLVENGYEVDYEKDITQNEVNKRLKDYDGIIITTKISLAGDVINDSNLKWIARAGSGLDHVDIAAATAKGITCITSPEGNSASVGEHCVGMLLSLLRRIPQANEATKSFTWKTDEYRVTELAGMTIGIIGYGNTGPEFAKRLQGFDVNVIAYDKYKTIPLPKESPGDKSTAKQVSLEELFEQTDVFSIHLPLTHETRGMIDEKFIARFKKNIYVINTSRGNIAPANVLLNGLVTGKITAAAIDVLDNENFETMLDDEKNVHKSLLNHPKLLITPHVAGKSSSTRQRHAKVLLSKILILRVL